MWGQQNVRCNSVFVVFLSLIYVIQGWKPVGKSGWTCLACQDNKVHSKDNALRHERTDKHVYSVQYHCANRQGSFGSTEDHGLGGREGFPSTHAQSMHGIGLVLEELSAPVGEYSYTVDEGSTPYAADSSETGMQFQESFIEKTREQLAATLASLLDEDKLSDDEGAGEINVESESGMEDTFAEAGSGMFLNEFKKNLIQHFVQKKILE